MKQSQIRHEASIFISFPSRRRRLSALRRCTRLILLRARGFLLFLATIFPRAPSIRHIHPITHLVLIRVVVVRLARFIIVDLDFPINQFVESRLTFTPVARDGPFDWMKMIINTHKRKSIWVHLQINANKVEGLSVQDWILFYFTVITIWILKQHGKLKEKHLRKLSF